MEEILLFVGRLALLICGVAFSLGVFTSRRDWAWKSLAGASAALVVTGLGYAMARPLDARPVEFFVGLVGVLVATALSARAAHWKVSAPLLGVISVTLPLMLASGVAVDIPSLFTFAASVAAPVAAAAIVLARSLSLPTLPRARTWVLVLVVLSIAGAVRHVFASLSYTGLDSTRLLLDLAPATAALALLALSLLPSPKVVAGIAVAALAIIAAAPGVVPATLPPAPTAALVSEKEVKQAQLAGLISMDEEEGAGPKPQYRGKSFEECDAMGVRDCFITYYDDLAMRKGVLAAVTDLIDRVENSSGATFAAHCHQTVHNLGQLSFEVIDNFTGASAIDPQVCATGFTHGLWEQQFTELGPEILFTRTSNLCRILIPVSDWYQWSCTHILGHALVTNMMSDPARALEYCDPIPDYSDRFNCIVGGWMNYFTDETVAATFTDYGSVREVFAMCYGAQEGLQKYLCYQEIFPVVYVLLGNSDYLAGEACLTLSEPTLRPEEDDWNSDSGDYAVRCLYGMGRGVAVLSQYDYRVATVHCQAMPEEAVDYCISAAAAGVTLNTGSVEAANRMCKVVREEKQRIYCYQWAKTTRALLENGPNVTNLPGLGEIRLPGQIRLF